MCALKQTAFFQKNENRTNAECYETNEQSVFNWARDLNKYNVCVYSLIYKRVCLCVYNQQKFFFTRNQQNEQMKTNVCVCVWGVERV